MLLTLSTETARAALANTHHPNPHIVLLGLVEALAALLFLVPRTMHLGAAGLIATIAVALVVHSVLGQFRGDLLLYGTVVVFVAIHGPLTSQQWKAAITRGAE